MRKNKDQSLKEQLKKAIEFGKYARDMYAKTPNGSFATLMIIEKITEGEEILANFDKTDNALIKRIIGKLDEISL